MPPDLSDRDRRALLSGGAVIAVLLVYLLWPGGESRPPAEPIRADLAATMPAAQPATYATPVPLPPVPAPMAAVPSVDVSQLRLYGLLSRGAVIGMADGTQRFVPVGREIVPGVTLRGVDVHHAILATASGEVRLGFDTPVQSQNVVVTTPATPPTP
jgi:hypothetical protein